MIHILALGSVLIKISDKRLIYGKSSVSVRFTKLSQDKTRTCKTGRLLTDISPGRISEELTLAIFVAIEIQSR